MIKTYFEIDKRIVEKEKKGKNRADYGKALLKNLSIELTKEFGKSFSVDNLENMRRFYLVYSKSETASRKFKISWSHYVSFSRVKNEDERNFFDKISTKFGE